jgi:S1-C subfamily serine protease
MRRTIVQSANSNVAARSSDPHSITPTVPQGKTPETRASGSGFFVTQAGHLLTNAHVIDGCRTIYVKSSDGQTGIAQVIAADQNDDLALLRVERRMKMTATFRTGRPTRAGESAVVFGFPLLELLASTM